MNKIKLALLSLLATVSLFSCKKDEEEALPLNSFRVDGKIYQIPGSLTQKDTIVNFLGTKVSISTILSFQADQPAAFCMLNSIPKYSGAYEIVMLKGGCGGGACPPDPGKIMLSFYTKSYASGTNEEPTYSSADTYGKPATGKTQTVDIQLVEGTKKYTLKFNDLWLAEARNSDDYEVYEDIKVWKPVDGNFEVLY